jgi:hypothetical protein
MNNAPWRTSSYSGNDGGACIEVAQAEESAVLVRDTKDRGGLTLRITAEAWRRFISVTR